MKYKSLQQLYGESVCGNVPPRKHLNVLGEAVVTVKFDDIEGEYKTRIEDVYARKVLGFTAGAKARIRSTLTPDGATKSLKSCINSSEVRSGNILQSTSAIATGGTTFIFLEP